MEAAARPRQRAPPSTTRTPAAPATCSPCPRLPSACRGAWRSKRELPNRLGKEMKLPCVSVFTHIKGHVYIKAQKLYLFILPNSFISEIFIPKPFLCEKQFSHKN